MKIKEKIQKLTLVTTLLFLAISSFSQITKIESKVIKETRVSLLGTYAASMNFYEDYVRLYFQDNEFTTISSIESFAMDYKTMDDLYELMTTKDKEKIGRYEVKTLGNEIVVVKIGKYLGAIYPTLYLYQSEYDETPSRMLGLTKRQYRKLFDKKKK